MGKWKKLKRVNLENNVKQPRKVLFKKASLKLDEMRKNIIVLYLFVSFWCCYIFILSISNRTEVFLLLKFSQNSQENTCAWVSFLCAASNFVNEETPTKCFPKPLTIFAKNSFVGVRLGYKYTSVLPHDLKPIYKDFLP